MVASLTDTQNRSDLAAWAEEYGSTHPVAGDYQRDVWTEFALSSGRPQYLVIDQDLVVVHAGRNAEEAEEVAESLLP